MCCKSQPKTPQIEIPNVDEWRAAIGTAKMEWTITKSFPFVPD